MLPAAAVAARLWPSQCLAAGSMPASTGGCPTDAGRPRALPSRHQASIWQRLCPTACTGLSVWPAAADPSPCALLQAMP
jgi:hypothetical protein